jgi:hypothetical protein
MMNLRIEDGYGSAVSITLLVHENAAIIDVLHETDMDDCYLDSTDLRDLARLALMAADELDHAKATA